VRVGIPILRESGGSTLRGKLRARVFFWLCLHDLFASQGAKGEEEYP
jgi:hypothetical protein